MLQSVEQVLMSKVFVAAVLALFLVPAAVWAEAPPAGFALQSDVDHVWTITAAVLVFFMQIGFLLLEAGSVRSKNSVNVAQKNLMDFVVSTVAFGAIGYTLMFGTSQAGWFGWSSELALFGSAGDWSLTFFVFQLMFCGTAATIMSGAVAERMTINGYLVAAVLIAVVIYPVAGHWVWGGLLNGTDTQLLASIGFIDFAGSTVVHSVGAWSALAIIIIIGPRIGKFDDDGKPRRMHAHSPILATAGVLILWLGWIGFNGGSALSGTSAFAQIIVNTVIAGGAGGFAALVLGRFTDGLFRPATSINGILGGLVAVTAGADLISPQNAFLIGMLGAVVVHFASWLLESVLRLDDPLGAIPVHGFAGTFGTIAVALFAPIDSLPAETRLGQLGIQLTGIGLVFAWAFGVTFAVMKTIDVVLKGLPDGGNGLRVPELFEREGLNRHEHDAPMGSDVLQAAMADLVRNPSATAPRIELDPGDEAYETSVLFNRIIDTIEDTRNEEESRYQRNKARQMKVEAEVSEVVKACSVGDFGKRLPVEGLDGFLLELCHGINELCQVTETAVTSVAESMAAVSQGNLSKRIDGDFRGHLGQVQTAVNGTLDQLSELLDDVQTSVEAAKRGNFALQISLDGRAGFFERLCTGINALCDISERGLSELYSVLEEVGDGDLTVSMSDAYEGRFADIAQAVTRMTRGISDMMDEVQETATEVSQKALDIATTAARVKSGSTEQVEALSDSEILLASFTQSATVVAKEATEADVLCKTACVRAEEGQSVSEKLQEQFKEIQATTAEIGLALEQIEAIALQTTLISLNASVEAARGSGGSNAGFKVVAQEVRDLANRSGAAAADIRAKTETVNSAVANGGKLVSHAASALSAIHQAMSESSEMVAGLSAAGAEQIQKTAALKNQIEIISDRAIQNLALARDSADLSSGLEDGSAHTIEQLGRFKRPSVLGQRAA